MSNEQLPNEPRSKAPSLLTHVVSRISRYRVLWEHTAVYFVGRSLCALATLGTVVIFVRLAGLREYGYFSLLTNLTATIATLGAQWLVQSVLRFQSQVERDGVLRGFRIGVFRGQVGSTLIGSTVQCAVLVAWHQSIVTVLLSCLALAIQIDYNICVGRLQAALTPRVVVFADVAKACTVLCVPIVITLSSGGLNHLHLLGGYAAGAAVADTTVRFRLALLPAPGHTYSERPNIMLRTITSYGIPLALSSGAMMLLPFAERYLIAWMLGLTAVGIYEATYSVIYRGIGLVLWPVAIAAQPLITSQWNDQRREAALKTVRVSVLVELAIMSIALPTLWTISPIITRMIVGSPMSSVRTALVPFCLAASAIQLATLIQKPVELANKTWALLRWALVYLAMGVACDYILIPRVGYVGAAYGALAGSLLYIALAWRWLRKWPLDCPCATTTLRLPILMSASPGSANRLVGDTGYRE